MLDCDDDGVVSPGDLCRFYCLVTGLSEDAARYHAGSILQELGKNELRQEDFDEHVSRLNLFAKFDLPPL
jgi:hypothetical protein